MATNVFNFGISEGIFEKNVKPLHDKVVLKKEEISHERNSGGIIIPQKIDVPTMAIKAEVVAIGPDAQKELPDLKVGDKVLYDALSVFYDTHPIVITKVENIICKIEE